MISVIVTAQNPTTAGNASFLVARNGSAVANTGVAQRIALTNQNYSAGTTALLALTAGDTIRIDFTTDQNTTIQPDRTHIAIHYMSF